MSKQSVNNASLKTFIEVRVSQRFSHCWKNAPKHREYLAFMHPHNFTVRLEMQVFEEDREIEFHDIQDLLYNLVSHMKHRWFESSCEAMARMILENIQEKYGKYREVQVEVWEDESCGGKIKYVPEAQVKS